VVEQFMSTRKTVILTLVLCFGAFAIAQAKPTEAELINQAKVKRNEAQRIALKQAPQGTIKSAEIENERGKLVWSFDISTPGTRDITEVLVDASTGAILSVAKETPKQQGRRGEGREAIIIVRLPVLPDFFSATTTKGVVSCSRRATNNETPDCDRVLFCHCLGQCRAIRTTIF
jgi:hypothetical protein